MEQILKRFTTDNLFNATSALLSKLNIQFDRETAEPISVAELYDTPMPKYLTEALECIKDTYFIGIVNDVSLRGEKAAESLSSVADTMQHGGKYDGMFIFACDAKSDANLTRTAASALTRAFNRIASANPVILIIRQGYLLSLATCERMEYSQVWRQGSGEKLGKVSILRNINCEHTHAGHLQILNQLASESFDTFDKLYKHWMKVFNSELLTKKFYNDLFEWYQWAVTPKTKVTFPGNADTQNDDREDIDTRVIRLITRLMFVWFIKQKGLVPDCIFNEEYLKTILNDFNPQSERDTNYYQAILQNLFFGTLNRAIIEDGEKREFAKASRSDVKNLYRYEELFSISEQEVIEMFSTVPFLNCGLFECQDKTKMLDGVARRYYNDGFSRNAAKFADGTYRYRAVVPNVLFFHPDKGILSIFKRYVFTIEENTPQDVQVALDPELLGKVFENLLGAYNPETKETARNQSGSFYTPREIVQYMVNESLVAHLKRTVGEHLEQQYRQLLDFTTETVELTDKEKKDILHSLFTCKVLDPACGSGAFPMGMLQQMVHILRQVDPDNSQWRDVLLNMAVDESRRAFGIVDEEERKKKLMEIEDTFNNGLNSPDYTRKLYIIESCIYGVDIQPIAMLITRLRFFITLICEQKDIRRDKPEENFGIKTLPNLESKFVAANSLIDADIHKYNEDWTNNEMLGILKDELMAIRRRHFYTRKRSEKMRLLREDEKKREQIHALINKLVGEPNHEHIAELERQIADNEALLPQYQGEKWVEETVQTDLFSEPETIRVDKNKAIRTQLTNSINNCKKEIERELNKCTPQGFEAAILQVTDWNPYDQNTVSPFLDMEWMFGVTDGFDIVIGNPPYLRIQGIRKISDVYANNLISNYQAATGAFDLYSCFAERGFGFINKDGFINYIMPIKWTNSAAGKGLRNVVLENKAATKIINFGAYQVFNASTYTSLIWFKPNSSFLLYNELNRDLSTNAELSLYLKELANSSFTTIPIQKLTIDTWILSNGETNNILAKLNKQPRRISDVFEKVFQGLATGKDDVYFIKDCSIHGKYLHGFSKMLKEKVILEYELCHPLLKGEDVHRYDDITASRYVVLPYRNSVALLPENEFSSQYPHCYEYFKRCEKILRGREKGRFNIDGEWYQLSRKQGLASAMEPKLVAPEISLGGNYAYDEKGVFYATTKIYGYIKKKEVKASYKTLMALLNSKVMWFFIQNTGYVLRGGYYTFKTNYVNPFPIPSDELLIEKETEIHALVDIILSAKRLNPQANTSAEENKIDYIVYKLYSLTYDEILLIDPNSPITREEYVEQN